MSVANGAPLLDVKDLTVAFKGSPKPVLSGITLSLRRNEVVGVVGETGAGKSVLARTLINLLPPGGEVLQGDVEFDGRSIFELSPDELRALRGSRIALIGTNAKALLDPVRRVGAQVAAVLRAHRRLGAKEAWSAAVELLASVGIADPQRCALAYPHQLSGGMAQRVVIATALVAGPEALLADDATLGLDATIQVQVLDLLAKRSRELGLGTLLITHDLGIVSRYCDRVAIMRGGRIIELSEVGRFFRHPLRDRERRAARRRRRRARPFTPSNATTASGSARARPLLEVIGLVQAFSHRRLARGGPRGR